MTKEELKKEFEKYLKDSADYYDPREPLTDRKLLQLWLDCAEPREKRIAELEAQIEKMKCCANCKYYQFVSSYCYKTCTKEGKLKGANYRSCRFDLEFWEMKND